MRTIVQFIFIFIALLILSGCTKMGPDFIQPTLPEIDYAFNKAQSEANATMDIEDWWKNFDDPNLVKLIETAQTQNITLQTYAFKILQAQAKMGIVDGEFYPQTQDATLGYSWHRSNDLNYKGLDSDLKFSWEIDVWGKFRRGIESAEADYFAAIAAYQDYLVQLNAKVALTYITVRVLQEQIRYIDEDIWLLQRAYDISKARYTYGETNELDLKASEALLYTTMAQLPPLRLNMQKQKDALAVLLGVGPYEINSLIDANRSIPKVIKDKLEPVNINIIRNRPDIKKAEFLVAAQSAQIGVAIAEVYPSLTLFGTIGFNPQIQFRDAPLIGKSTFNYFVGPEISLPFLQYGRLENNIRLQDALFEEYVSSYQFEVLKAVQEIEDSIVGYVETKNEVTYLDKGVQGWQRAVDLALLRYNEGQSNFDYVINIMQNLIKEQLKFAKTKGEVSQYMVTLYESMGAGYDANNNRPLVTKERMQKMNEVVDWGCCEDNITTKEQFPEQSNKLFPKVMW